MHFLGGSEQEAEEPHLFGKSRDYRKIGERLDVVEQGKRRQMCVIYGEEFVLFLLSVKFSRKLLFG